MCDRHFRDDQFQTSACLKLNRNAYPILNLVEEEAVVEHFVLDQEEPMDVEGFPEAIQGPSTSKTYSQMGKFYVFIMLLCRYVYVIVKGRKLVNLDIFQLMFSIHQCMLYLFSPSSLLTLIGECRDLAVFGLSQ